jgi:hypothetical protein
VRVGTDDSKGTNPFDVAIAYFLRMHRPLLLTAALVALSACHHGPATPAPEASDHSLSGLAAQRVAVLPSYAVRVMPGLAWSVGRVADVQAALDADIAAAFDERGLKRAWTFPDELDASYRRNPTYATDPRHMAEEPLRSPTLSTDARLPDPLASQVRTLVALQPEMRLVLAPVELRFEPVNGGGRGVLRVVLLDARFSTVRWIGEFASDSASSFGPVISATIAARLAAAVAPQ